MGAGDDVEAALLKQAFKAVDAKGTGRFSREDLAKVFRQLGEWSQEDLDELFDAVDTDTAGQISYTDLVEYIMDDDDGGEEPDEDEGEDGNHCDAHIVQNLVDPDGHTLNLDTTLTRDEFMKVLGMLDLDASEATSIFEEVEGEAKDAGLCTKAGIKVKWFLDELGIDRRDQEGLHHLEKAIEAVRAGKEPAPGRGEYSETIALEALAEFVERLGKTPEDAWDAMMENHILSKAGQEAIVQHYSSDKAALVSIMKTYMKNPPMLPASAGQVSNREKCKAKFDKLVGECRAAGKKFVDAEFDVQGHTAECFWVDKEQPGYDCTVAKPSGFKRLSELAPKAVLFKGGTNPGDIKQGRIGTCFLLGALGAVAANKKDAIRRAFLACDIELGIYGIRFCVDGEWEYVFVDDVVPVDQHGRVLFAKSADPEEVWVSIIEKAYCKLHTCYEMCDGGKPTQAIFTLCSGASGVLSIQEEHKKDPKLYFHVLDQALKRGRLLTTTFVVVAGAAKAGAGKCGEAVLPTGLVGGHVYSVLRLVEADGQQLVCCRNPWGSGEWKGKYSDENKNNEWTPTMKKHCHWSCKEDGRFWMCIEDFVLNSSGVEYARTFGPQWKKITQKGKFELGTSQAKSLWAFKARSANELSFDKGAAIEVTDITPGWWCGNVAGAPAVTGFFPSNYVKMAEKPVARFDLVATADQDENPHMDIVIMLMQPESKMQRKFFKRPDNSMNYKDVSYPDIQLVVIGDDGKVVFKRSGKKRSVEGELSLEGGRTWRIFALSLDGKGQVFTLKAFAKGGSVSLEQIEGANLADVTKMIA